MNNPADESNKNDSASEILDRHHLQADGSLPYAGDQEQGKTTTRMPSASFIKSGEGMREPTTTSFNNNNKKVARNFVIARKEKQPDVELRHQPVSCTPNSSTQRSNHPDSRTIKQKGTIGGKYMTRSPSPPFPKDEEQEPAAASEEDDDKKKDDDMTGLRTPTTAHQRIDVIAVDSSSNHHVSNGKNSVVYNLHIDDESSPEAANTRKAPSSAPPVAVTTPPHQQATVSPSVADTKDIVLTMSNNKTSPSRSLAGANAMIVMLKQEQDKRMEEMAELKGQNSELIVDKRELEDKVKDRNGIIAALQKENAALILAKTKAEKQVADLANDLQVVQQAHDILGGIFLHRSAASRKSSRQHHHNDADGGNGGGLYTHSSNDNKHAGDREAKTPVVTKTVGGTVSPYLPPPPSTRNKTTTAVVAGTKTNCGTAAAAAAITTTTAASAGGDATSNYDPPPPPPNAQSSPRATATSACPPLQPSGHELLEHVRQYWDNPLNYPLDNIDLDRVALAWKPRVTDPRQEVMILSNNSNNYLTNETTRRFEKGEIIGKGDRGWTVEFPSGDKTNTYKKYLFPHPDLLIHPKNL